MQIISTGGTARLLRAEGIDATDVSAVTGFPEIMDGRVKTLHPKIHGGLLGRRGTDDAVMREHGIEAIDLVVVNLYPFAATIAKPGCTFEDAVENIDIGGPAMRCAPWPRTMTASPSWSTRSTTARCSPRWSATTAA